MILSSIRETFKDSFWYGIATVLSRASGIILLPLYAHWFVPAEMGAIQAVIVFLAVLQTIISAGMISAINRFYFDYKRSNESRKLIGTHVIMIVSSAAVIALLLLALSKSIAIHILGNPHSTSALKLGIVGICFLAINEYFAALLRLERRLKKYLLVNLSQSVLLIISNIIFIRIFGVGYMGVFGAMLTTHTILLILFYGPDIIKLREALSLEIMKRTATYCLPLILIAILEWSRMYFYQLYIGTKFGEETLGLVTVAMRIVQLYVMTLSAFHMAWTVKSMETMHHPKANLLYQHYYKYSLVVTIILFTFLALFSKEIIALIASSDYAIAYQFVTPIFIIAFGETLTSFFEMGILISEKTFLYLMVHVASACIGIPIVIGMAMYFGVYGALYGAAIFSIFLAFASLVLANKVKRIGYSLKPLLTLFLIYLCFGLYNSLISNTTLSWREIIAKIVAGFVIIGLTNKLWLNNEERNSVWLAVDRLFKKIQRLSFTAS